MESDSPFTDIFSELASETRCDILSLLAKHNLKQSQIVKKLDLTIQETHRQTMRLQNAGMIDKNPDGTLTLTEYGKIITKHISHYDVLSKFGPELNKYSVDGIPLKLIQNINSLSNGKIVKSVTAVLEICKTIFLEADKFVKIIAPQVINSFDGLFDVKFEKGFKIDYIYGKNTIVPKSTAELSDKKQIRELLSSGMVNRRMLDIVNYGLVVSDRHAGLILISDYKEPEINFMIVGEDKEFRNWCNELFKFAWDDAKPFDITQTNLV